MPTRAIVLFVHFPLKRNVGKRTCRTIESIVEWRRRFLAHGMNAAGDIERQVMDACIRTDRVHNQINSVIELCENFHHSISNPCIYPRNFFVGGRAVEWSMATCIRCNCVPYYAAAF